MAASATVAGGTASGASAATASDGAGSGAAVLTAAEAELLERRKRQVQLDDEAYLRAHPELKELVNGFLASVLERKPADVVAFAVAHFCGPAGAAAAAGSAPGSDDGGDDR